MLKSLYTDDLLKNFKLTFFIIIIPPITRSIFLCTAYQFY